MGTQREQLTVSTSCCRMGQLLPLLGFFLLPFKAQSPRTESLGAGGGSSGLSPQGGQTRVLTPTGVGGSIWGSRGRLSGEWSGRSFPGSLPRGLSFLTESDGHRAARQLLGVAGPPSPDSSPAAAGLVHCLAGGHALPPFTPMDRRVVQAEP